MLHTEDPLYTYVHNPGGFIVPVEGRVLDIRPTQDYPENFAVTLELIIPDEDGFWPTKIHGTYTPGKTLTEGGCEYISIRETVKRYCRTNCYVFTDRIYNLQLCLHHSAAFASNARHACKKILTELRSLGQEPPENVVEMMGRVGLK